MVGLDKDIRSLEGEKKPLLFWRRRNSDTRFARTNKQTYIMIMARNHPDDILRTHTHTHTSSKINTCAETRDRDIAQLESIDL